MVDSGSTNNYIKSNLQFGNRIKLNQNTVAKTLHGFSEVRYKQEIRLLKQNLEFFEIDKLIDFDMILGEKSLRKMKAQINFFEYKLYYSVPKDNITEEKQKIELQRINFTNDCDEFANEIHDLMEKNEKVYSTLPFTTTIEASIKTINDNPVWVKQYPYPMSDHEFVTNEIERLLENGIIQKSFSPYNSPIWTVPKKGVDENGKPKRRMVIDYSKLNSQTIADRYPIPDINLTLQNLGNAKYFSTVDLESGFHQIKIKESDREKTAFAINGAKYEFIRMPFGLKNAPSIFQRCVDDILRPYIGKFAYVYIDDVLIFSKTKEEHMQHIAIIVNALHKANMKISSEKSHFFKTSIEFLGHIIKNGRITVDPIKTETIQNYPIPKTLKELRSFLGLTGYYRKFIKGYAKIVKPLTIHLRGENGQIGKNHSAKVSIKLDNAAIDAFEMVKQKLCEQIELYQPCFDKPFELTTDASNFSVGAVLSQGRHPIMFISRTLNETEQNYATNEKELLAIVWALQKLRNFLYGIADLTIYTDHQSLKFSVSEKNPNNKLKRWKNLIEEFGAKLEYKPGNENIVADALSRIDVPIDTINTSSLETSEHSIDSSPIEPIPKTHKSVNNFRNQLHIYRADTDETSIVTIFPNYHVHKIKYKLIETLISYLKTAISNQNINALYTTEETFFRIKNRVKEAFPTVKFVYCPNSVTNVTNRNEQLAITETVHKRAHRNYKNNILEISENYFWPQIRKDCKQYASKCEICLTEKYERHPKLEIIKPTPIPNKPGIAIHMDIFQLGSRIFVSTSDRFSKYFYLREIPNKRNLSLVIEEILSQIYPECQEIMTDNDAIFIAQTVQALYREKNITLTTTPVSHSTTNGQVERVHSTILEIANALAKQNETETVDEIFNAVTQYNNTIHSVTRFKPIEIFFNNPKIDFNAVKTNIQLNQEKTLNFHNKKRIHKTFKTGDIVFMKSDRRRKDKKAYKRFIVQEDQNDTIVTTTGKIIHKDSLRNVSI